MNMYLSIFLQVVAVLAAAGSCWCCWRVRCIQKEQKKVLDVMKENHREQEAAISGYKDLSSGPRYREYGDLS